MKKIITLASLSVFAVLQALGWGQKGHDTTAYIAEQHLTPAARAAVDSIFGGMSMVYWANWLDNASHTPAYSYTKTWHYKNIDAGVDYDKATVNPRGDIITALKEQIAALQGGKLTRQESALALKIVVHLLGDLHQPMHLGHQSDLGGNRWVVKYFGRENKLHSIWDGSLVESAHKWSYTEWQQQIDRADEATIEALTAGTLDDWGRETYTIAGEVYDSTPEGSEVSYDYIARWTPTIEQQFLKGGLRLADILNGIFDAGYTPQSQVLNK